MQKRKGEKIEPLLYDFAKQTPTLSQDELWGHTHKTKTSAFEVQLFQYFSTTISSSHEGHSAAQTWAMVNVHFRTRPL